MNKTISKEEMQELAKVSDLLYYHAALGNGYEMPIPEEGALVFSAMTTSPVRRRLDSAVKAFRREETECSTELREQIRELEQTPGMEKQVAALKAKTTQNTFVTWQEDQVSKSTLTELTATSRYGALTYVDSIGARMTTALVSPPARLAQDLGWQSLTGDSNDNALIRSSSTGSTKVFSMNANDVRFNYFCNLTKKASEQLVHRVKKSLSGSVGQGRCLIIPENRTEKIDHIASDKELKYLLDHVFTRGGRGGNKVKFEFLHQQELVEEPKDPDNLHYEDDTAFLRVVDSVVREKSRKDFDELMDMEVQDMIDSDGDWEINQMFDGPTSPAVAVQMGLRSVIVEKFVNMAHCATELSASPDRVALARGEKQTIPLIPSDIETAKQRAKLLFQVSNGYRKIQNRLANVEKAMLAQASRYNPEELMKAKAVFTKLINEADGDRVSRRKVRDTPGITLGQLDELIERGDIQELSGKDQCNMGNTTFAYRLPQEVTMDMDEAVAEYEDAQEDYLRDPDSISTEDVVKAKKTLTEKAEKMKDGEALPVVPFDSMSKQELRALPKLLAINDDVVPRGNMIDNIPDNTENMHNVWPEEFGCGGMWLWVRNGSKGQPLMNWDKAIGTGLHKVWGEDTNEVTMPLPAEYADKLEPSPNYQ